MLTIFDRQHIQKLQKKEGVAAAADGSDTPTPKKTPVKRKAAPKKAKVEDGAEDGDGEEPVKKKRGRKPKAKPLVNSLLILQTITSSY